MPAPDINYLWVGPPTKGNPNSLPGHDIAGPISLCKEFQKDIYNNKEKNIIKFWCLKKYYDDFQQLFKNHGVQIEVCAIEDLLEKEKKLDDPFTNRLAENLSRISQVEKMNKGELIDFEDLKMGELIDFKDRFSLYLLMKQPGYFLDTNVFPKPGLRLDFPPQENFVTAKSGFSESNDFYLMYSPNNNEKLKKAFDNRMTVPYHRAGIMTFNNLSIPSNLNLDSLGVEKVSYKSYKGSDVPGFFRLLELDFEKFKEHSKYANINQQMPCPFSKRLTSECSLCWLEPPENIKSLTITTEYAYIAGGFKDDRKPRIYFYDKKRNEAVLVSNELTSIFDYFPRYSESKSQIGAPEQLNDLMDFFREQKPNAPHPPVLVNIDGGTLLHHAVMTNNIEKVRWLIEMGARLDLKALYQTQPSESDIRYEFTPIQLAQFLKHDAIIDFLQKHTEQATPVDHRNPETKIKETPAYDPNSNNSTHIISTLMSAQGTGSTKSQKFDKQSALLQLQNAIQQLNLEVDVEINPGTENTPGLHLRVIGYPSMELSALAKAFKEIGVEANLMYKGKEEMLVISNLNLDVAQTTQLPQNLKQAYDKSLPLVKKELSLQQIQYAIKQLNLNVDIEINPGTEKTPGLHLRVVSYPSLELSSLAKSLKEVGIDVQLKHKGQKEMLVISNPDPNISLKRYFTRDLDQAYMAVSGNLKTEYTKPPRV